jgi:hypothetical protein
MMLHSATPIFFQGSLVFSCKIIFRLLRQGGEYRFNDVPRLQGLFPDLQLGCRFNLSIYSLEDLNKYSTF